MNYHQNETYRNSQLCPLFACNAELAAEMILGIFPEISILPKMSSSIRAGLIWGYICHYY